MPVNTVQRVVPQLIAHGEYTPAQLGILPANQRTNRIVAQRLGVAGGVLIVQVTPRSAADRAGLRGTDDQLGDIILRIDDESVLSLRDLRAVLDRYEPGDEVEVTIIRDGETQDAVVTLM